VLVCTAAGCGESRDERVPVSGRVLIDGKLLKAGMVRFVPEAGRPASSAILSDGSFNVSSEAVNHVSQSGLTPGKYRVQVSASNVIDDTTIHWNAPARYADFRTSGLSVTIQEPIDDLIIKLTWEGAEPNVKSASADNNRSNTKQLPSDDQGDNAI
jgi:hypothetical protein